MLRKYLKNGLITTLAFVCVDARVVRGSDNAGAVAVAATSAVASPSSAVTSHNVSDDALSSKIIAALKTLTSAVRPLSHPKALETAFHSYFAYLNAHPSDVRKPLLYFVDYGLPSTQPNAWNQYGSERRLKNSGRPCSSTMTSAISGASSAIRSKSHRGALPP